MKYLVRAIKYFFYFSIICAAIVSVLVLCGLAESNIDQLFNGGWNAVWKILVLFAAVGAVYPKVGFITRDAITDSLPDNYLESLTEYMKERQYVLEKHEGDITTFRHKGMLNRLTRMFEDRITLTRTESGFNVEGLRKDVIRICMGIENRYRCSEDPANE